jgi:hypothetical protein
LPSSSAEPAAQLVELCEPATIRAKRTLCWHAAPSSRFQRGGKKHVALPIGEVHPPIFGAEPMLFIDHRQSQPRECDILGENGMGSHNHVNVAEVSPALIRVITPASTTRARSERCSSSSPCWRKFQALGLLGK